MSHFFNFCVDEDGDECKAGPSSDNQIKKVLMEKASCDRLNDKPARLIPFDELELYMLHSVKNLAQHFNFSTISLLSVTPGAMLHHLLSHDSADARSRAEELQQLMALTDAHHSDLLPGVYEGGFKIWECAHDLVHYLVASDIQFSGMRVLELGCGAGLPGITAILKGAESTCFQDYNEEVLMYLTVPNVYLNTSTHPQQVGVLPRCRFYSGDWVNVAKLMVSNHDVGFDVILTAETIYCAEHQPTLLQTLKDLISPKPSSLVVLAAKTHYFGVGGSLQMFRELVERDGFLEVVDIRTINSHLPRQILILKPHKNTA